MITLLCQLQRQQPSDSFPFFKEGEGEAQRLVNKEEEIGKRVSR